MKKAGFTNIRIVKDTYGTERVVIGQLKEIKSKPNEAASI